MTGKPGNDAGIDVVVPTTAVQVSSSGTYVYVVEDEVAVTRQVEVSRSTADENGHQIGPVGR